MSEKDLSNLGILEFDEEEESPVDFGSCAEKCNTLFSELKSDYPKFLKLWEIYKENELFFKEVRIKVSFPFKRVSTFVVLKQVMITFKIGESSYLSYKLYLQTLMMNTSTKDKLDIKNRIVWSKGGRFITDTDTKVDPEIMGILFKLGEIFALTTKSIIDIPFPFLS